LPNVTDHPEREVAVIEFLDRLEREEERLLVWGVVDGAFSGPEVESLAEKYLDDRDLWHVFPDPDDLLSLLDERRLLFRFIEGTRPGIALVWPRR
jgi:hypothetical protein